MHLTYPEKPTLIAPAPWTLQGKGYILLYRFSKEFVERQGFLTNFHKQYEFRGIIGAVMLVDYGSSPVGGYQEILFVPGMFRFAQTTAFNISKIYVSTYESVYNGIKNWGIPKELATFSLEKQSNGFERFEVFRDGKNFFRADLKSFGLPVYVNTAWFPFRFYQPLGEQVLLTKPHGKGWAKFCKAKNIQVNASFFPDISTQKLLAAMLVPHFTMSFPIPQIVKAN
ncbi:MAG: hypothetical protein OHK0045_01340 [Raineya sp.]